MRAILSPARAETRVQRPSTGHGFATCPKRARKWGTQIGQVLPAMCAAAHERAAAAAGPYSAA
eukprot:6462211-Prymnesium_polylepis.1